MPSFAPSDAARSSAPTSVFRATLRLGGSRRGGELVEPFIDVGPILSDGCDQLVSLQLAVGHADRVEPYVAGVASEVDEARRDAGLLEETVDVIHAVEAAADQVEQLLPVAAGPVGIPVVEKAHGYPLPR